MKELKDLTSEELTEYNKKTSILYKYFITSETPVTVSWDSVNNVLGLEHLYRETFDKMNEFLKRDRYMELNYDENQIWSR